MNYTVYNLPLFLKTIWVPIAWIYALCNHLVFYLIYWSCTVNIKKHENIKGNENYIYAMWHEHLVPYFVVHRNYKKPYIWMTHHAWYMLPIYNMHQLIGTQKIAWGSTGNSGRKALQKVVENLKDGYNTVLNPDGPKGPLRTLKHGVLDMSLRSQTPIVPLKIQTSKSFTIPNTWDKKRVPLPFSTVTLVFEQPITVTKLNYYHVKKALELTL